MMKNSSSPKKRKINNKKALRQTTTNVNPRLDNEIPREMNMDIDKILRRLEVGEIDKRVREMMKQSIEQEIPQMIEIRMSNLKSEIENVNHEERVTQDKELSATLEEQKGIRDMIDNLRKDLERQRKETEVVWNELAYLQESNRKEAQARSENTETLRKRIDELGKTFKKTFEEVEKRQILERRVTQEQMKSMVMGELEQERAARAQDHKYQTNQMQEIFREATKVFQNKAAKLSSQFAQTVLDVQGLQNRVTSIDKDLQATSEVAASTSE